MKALIAGAGIGGLTTALFLHGAHWKGRIGGSAMSDGADIIRPLPIEAPSDYRGERNVHIDS